MTLTDTELLDFLQAMLDRKRYSGRVVARENTQGRGILLNESREPKAVKSIREAIVNFIARVKPCEKCGGVNTEMVNEVHDLVDPLHVEAIYNMAIFKCFDCGHHFTQEKEN